MTKLCATIFIFLLSFGAFASEAKYFNFSKGEAIYDEFRHTTGTTLSVGKEVVKYKSRFLAKAKFVHKSRLFKKLSNNQCIKGFCVGSKIYDEFNGKEGHVSRIFVKKNRYASSIVDYHYVLEYSYGTLGEREVVSTTRSHQLH